MSTFFDFFRHRHEELISDAEENTRKEREDEQQLIAEILCHDGFHCQVVSRSHAFSFSQRKSRAAEIACRSSSCRCL